MEIETHSKLWSSMPFHPYYRRKRYRISKLVTHIEPADIFGVRSKWAVCLDINLPCPPEQIEIIDKRTAHEDLRRLVHVGQINSLLQNLLLIDIEIKLRNAWQPSG